MRLRGLDFRDLLQLAHLDFHLPHAKLLDLATCGHGELVHKAEMLRYFEMRDFPMAEIANLVLLCTLARLQPNPGYDSFPKSFVGNAQYLCIGDLRMRVQQVFNFARINVFTTSDNHVFRASSNV